MVDAVRLILSDIDGTILDSQHQVDKELPKWVTMLKEKSIPFVLTSARSPYGMFPIAEELGLGTSPLACYNGALIIEGDAQHYQILIEHGLNKSDVRQVLDLVQNQFPHISVNVYSASDWIVEKIDRWVEIESDITKERPQVQNLKTFLLDGDRTIHKLLLIAESSEIQDFFSYLQKLEFEDAAFYLSKDNYLEMTAQSVSKENALFEIARYYDLPLETAMTIGDNYNDLPMLKLAGLGVAMGNAPQEVKEAADVQTTSNDAHGVSRAISKYALNRQY